MDTKSPGKLTHSVRAQAVLRFRLGLVVTVVILLTYFLWRPLDFRASINGLVAMACLYIAYQGGALLVSRRAAPGAMRYIIIATAILDPLMLSGWLHFVGDLSILIVGFYIFTILGFGFRIGTAAMHLCQAVSIVGFSLVALTSPSWNHQLLMSLSHLVLLFVVPLYASTLITHLHRAKALAERESRAKTQLLANVSHELRTPLTGIVSSAELLEAETREAGAKTRAKSILKLAKALDTEIKQLLDLAKIESTSIDSEPLPMDLSSAAGQVVEALAPVAQVKQLALRLEMDPAIKLPVRGRVQELNSVLMNLAGNALKFTRIGTVTITIRLLEDTGNAYRIWFGVRDTGIGIAPEHLQKIFEPFYQVEGGTRRKYGGTGLGTTIAKEHVKKMGGMLRVESDEGQGTLFSFELNMAHAPARMVPVEAEPSVVSRRVTGKRVLIADDNALNLELMREMLAKDGQIVTTATSGEDAIRILSDSDFDIVFLDFNMSDMDGAAVFQAYRFFRFDVAPTFFVTADTTPQTVGKLDQLDAAGVIHKPLTFEKLRGAINSRFPGESVEHAQPAARSTAEVPRLRAVPVEFIDPEAIDTLREIKDNPVFLHKMLSDGICDIETMQDKLAVSIRGGEVTAVHRDAHAMRGVSLTLGAVRLSALNDRLMTITSDALQQGTAQILKDLEEITRPSLAALRELRDGFGAQAERNSHSA